MKNKILNNKGITLVALIITIIVLLILTSVATYSGIEAIENSKYTKFKSELKIMQTYINNWYEECKPSNENETFAENIAAKFTNIAGKGVNAKVATNDTQAETTLNNAGIVNNHDHYYLLQKEQKEALGVDNDGVTQDVLVSIIDRKVVSYLGMKYKDKMYYTLEDLDEFYNVEYDSTINSGTASFDISQEYVGNGKSQITISNIKNDSYNNKWKVKYKNGDGNWNTTNDLNFLVTDSGHYTVTLYNEGISGTNEIDVLTAPECWRATTASDSQWYSYGGAKVNSPKLIGKMTPIKYTGDLTGETNLWANAETADQSMWVWIPRYAYKITSGYHKNAENGGTIEIAFLKGTSNTDFWDTSHNGEAITANPSEVTYTEKVINGITEQVQDQWLVHPAFTSKPENGGWDKELTGIWFAKFEATGTSATESTSAILSAKPGLQSLRSMTINEQFLLAKSSTFNENISANNLGSHMAKNSEWGAVCYLTQSSYGAGVKISKNSNYYTGGSNIYNTIYETNKLNSTTNNATGVYDMNGGANERMASYVKYTNNSNNILTYGGTMSGDLFGADNQEQSTSTKYKTVYAGSTEGSEAGSYSLLNTNKTRGDAIWETSNSYIGRVSWYNTNAGMPSVMYPCFLRGGYIGTSYPDIFYYYYNGGNKTSDNGFRPVMSF